MALWKLQGGEFAAVPETDFASEALRERQDLQSVLRDHIEAVVPNVMVLTEEFRDWDDSSLRIDLLGIDDAANLVVIELKRTSDAGHAELQALRYSAMVSSMTFEQAAQAHASYLTRRGEDDSSAAENILSFLGWDEPRDEEFALDVRIVLVAAGFQKPLTATVLWLRERGVDIRCVQMAPYRASDGGVLLDIRQLIPLPEAADFQVSIAQKQQRQRESRASRPDRRVFALQIDGSPLGEMRKNRTAYLVAAAAIRDHGVSPEAILETKSAQGRNKNVPLILVFDGTLGSAEFEALATQRRRDLPGRYYTSDDDLFHVDGRTWAFTNQWSHTEEQPDVTNFISELQRLAPALRVVARLGERTRAR